MTRPPGMPMQAWSAMPDLSPQRRLQPLVTRDKADLPEANLFTDTSPRTLTSILHNFMEDDADGTTRLKDDLDLVVHALESGRPVTNATVQEVCRMNPRLRRLVITGCREVSDVGVWAIARQCTGLTDLRMGGCDQITYIGLRSLALCCRDLRVLDFFESETMDDRGLRVLGSGCWNLTQLNLEGCVNITDNGLAEIAQCCVKLQRLNVSRCMRLGEFGDKALLQIGRHCRDLRQLDMFGCKHVRDPGLIAIAKGCRQLEVLKLTGCRELTGDALRALARGCTRLVDLSVAGCEKVQSDDLYALTAACTGLTALNIEKCVLVSTRGIRGITKNLARLYSLNLTGCRGVQDDCADLIARNCFSLRSLNLSECPKISEVGVRRLVHGCTALAYLNLTGCERISRKFLQGVVRDLMFSEWANDYFGYQPKPNADELRVQQEIFQTHSRAAVEIQRVWRGCRSRGGLHAIRLRFVEQFVLPRVQANVRGFIQRKLYLLRRERAARFHASCAIQAWWRGRLGYSHYQELWRLRELHKQHTRAAVKLQRIFRGHRQRGVYNAVKMGILMEQLRERRVEEMRNRIVVHIQRMWRGRHGRRQARDMFELREQMRERRRLEERVAATLQRVFRGHAGRLRANERRLELVRMKEEQTAALRLQSLVRGYQGRLAARIQRLARDKERREQAAITLQNFWRYVRARHVSSMLRALTLLRATEQKAVVKIQALTRGVLERRRLAAEREQALADKRCRDAARNIQRVFRGHKGREEFEVQIALAQLQEMARPLFLQVEHLEAELLAAEKASTECEGVLRPLEADTQMLSEELEECMAIRTKYHDSARITGAPQRYLTKFLQLNLAEQLKEGRDRVQLERDRLTDLQQLVRALEKRLRQAKRELEPLTHGKRQKTMRERSIRLRREARVEIREHSSARLLQRVYRGYRTRRVIAVGANYWERMLDEETDKEFFLHLRTQEVRWSEPLDVEVWGETKMSRSWIECTDADSGEVYFFNVDTKEKRFDKPDDMDGVDAEKAEEEAAAAASAAAQLAEEEEWERREDAETGQVYFVSRVTGDIKWEEADAAAAAEAEAARAAEEQAAEDLRLAEQRAAEEAKKWVERVDSDTGASYWLHTETGDIAWSPRNESDVASAKLQAKIDMLDADEHKEDYPDRAMHQEWLATALAGGRLVTAEVVVDEMLERQRDVKLQRQLSLREEFERSCMEKEEALSAAVEAERREEERKAAEAAAAERRKARRKKKGTARGKKKKKKKGGVPEPDARPGSRGTPTGKKRRVTKRQGSRKTLVSRGSSGAGSVSGLGGVEGEGEGEEEGEGEGEGEGEEKMAEAAAAAPIVEGTEEADDDDEDEDEDEEQKAEKLAQQRKAAIAQARAEAKAKFKAERAAARQAAIDRGEIVPDEAEAEEDGAPAGKHLTDEERAAKEAEEILAEVAEVVEGAEEGAEPAQADDDVVQEDIQAYGSDPWVEMHDDEGNVYYYNSETEETAWEKPGEDGGVSAQGSYDESYWSDDYYSSDAYYSDYYDEVAPDGGDESVLDEVDPFAEDAEAPAEEVHEEWSHEELGEHGEHGEHEHDESAHEYDEQGGYYDESGVYHAADGSMWNEDGSYFDASGSFYNADGSLHTASFYSADGSVHEEGSTYSDTPVFDDGSGGGGDDDGSATASVSASATDGGGDVVLVEWVEYFDEEAGAAYYFNPETQEASWTVPSNAAIISAADFAARWEAEQAAA